VFIKKLNGGKIMINIDLNAKTIKGTAKVKDIKKYGLIKASLGGE